MRCGARRRDSEALLYAFDLIEHDSDDLCNLPLSSASGGSSN
jgi:ATP-dependent DNA ligase